MTGKPETRCPHCGHDFDHITPPDENGYCFVICSAPDCGDWRYKPVMASDPEQAIAETRMAWSHRASFARPEFRPKSDPSMIYEADGVRCDMTNWPMNELAKVPAIKLARFCFGISLRGAKDLIESDGRFWSASADTSALVNYEALKIRIIGFPSET